jgi:hypothetical protein
VNSGASEFYNIKAIEIAQTCENMPDFVVKSALGRHPLECVEGHVNQSNISEKMDQLK